MKKIIFFLITIFSVHVCLAQKHNEDMQTAVFEDGTKIDFKLLQTDLSEMHEWAIETARLNSYIRYIGVYHYVPDKYYACLNLGLEGIGAEVVYYLRTEEKPTNLSVPLKQEYSGNNTITKYMIKIPDAKRKIYLGAHVGYAHIFSKDLESEEITLGGALVRGRHVKTLIQMKKGKLVTKRGTSFNTLYADLLVYPGRKVLKKTEQGSIIGFQIYYGGHTSFWGGREWGLQYYIGGGSCPTGFFPVIGLWLYAGF